MINIPCSVIEAQKFVDSDADHFAPNAYDLADAKMMLLNVVEQVKKYGGKVYVEREMLDEDCKRPHYDTMFIVLPPPERLPSLINRADKEYVKIALDIDADEKHVIDSAYLKGKYRSFDDTYDALGLDKNIVIHLWWD